MALNWDQDEVQTGFPWGVLIGGFKKSNLSSRCSLWWTCRLCRVWDTPPAKQAVCDCHHGKVVARRLLCKVDRGSIVSRLRTSCQG
jgi:hypothetical protein